MPMTTIVPKPTVHNFIDLTGQTFGMLTVVSYAGKRGRGSYWNCTCQCGGLHTSRGSHLKSGGTKSCGCFKKTCGLTHGLTGSRMYKVWSGMTQRCHNSSSSAFHNYGAKGRKVCSRWRNSFPAFINDMGPRPSPKHSIDRIDNDGDYTPENTRWATDTEQARNKSVRENNKTGITGVSPAASGRYKSRITVNYKTINLGTYVERWDAICARKSGELTHW